jgi:predicted site-specific integrase-resolvase
MFSKIPHRNTLQRWVHEGHIQPQPEKIGKTWQVKRDARYVD